MTASGPPRRPLLFARNLFLPADLGGNRYPYEVVRRLGERGHPVPVATPRLHDAFPPLPGVRYHFYPVNRRHPALTHVTNVLGGTLGLRPLRGQRFPVALVGSYDAAMALGWSGVVPRTPMIFLFHSEFYSEWVQALRRSSPRALARRAIRAYMAAVERRVFGLSARLVAVSEFSARQIRSRAPEVADRVRVIPTGVDTGYFVPPADPAAAKRAV
ncbi:MAG: glycosyltransferase, partial [Polyangiaceae bacterium]|nr:glycosyltransferase [Polyangiaceae bacterium]